MDLVEDGRVSINQSDESTGGFRKCALPHIERLPLQDSLDTRVGSWWDAKGELGISFWSIHSGKGDPFVEALGGGTRRSLEATQQGRSRPGGHSHREGASWVATVRVHIQGAC